jgi:Uma2 family endonuclease
MGTVSDTPFKFKATKPIVLPLQNGDVLTGEEFMRRYEAMPEGTRAELINHVVYMIPPASFDHSESEAYVFGWLLDYARATPGTRFLPGPTVKLDRANHPQPDAVLFIEASALTRVLLVADNGKRYVTGPPELIVEVALTSSSYDLHQKRRAYHRARVLEYMVWQYLDSQLYWFSWAKKDYVTMKPDADGILRSKVFSGLWLDPLALLRGDQAKVARVLKRGLRSPEHATFLRRLAGTEARPNR